MIITVVQETTRNGLKVLNFMHGDKVLLITANRLASDAMLEVISYLYKIGLLSPDKLDTVEFQWGTDGY